VQFIVIQSAAFASCATITGFYENANRTLIFK